MSDEQNIFEEETNTSGQPQSGGAMNADQSAAAGQNADAGQSADTERNAGTAQNAAGAGQSADGSWQQNAGGDQSGNCISSRGPATAVSIRARTSSTAASIRIRGSSTAASTRISSITIRIRILRAERSRGRDLASLPWCSVSSRWCCSVPVSTYFSGFCP